MRNRSVLSTSLATAMALLFVACADDPSSVKPSPLTPGPIAGVEVIGPDAVFSGQSAQFVVSIRLADGSTKSATSMQGLRWRSSNPWVMSVSNTGLVTASTSQSGEALITADITSSGAQGSRAVLVKPAVTAVLDVTRQRTTGQGSYAFAVTLNEAAGVPTTVTSIWITFDAGWGGQCSWTPNQLRQSRVPANGMLVLDALTCGFDEVSDVEVSIELKNDNGETTQIYQYRSPVVG